MNVIHHSLHLIDLAVNAEIMNRQARNEPILTPAVAMKMFSG